MGRRQLSGMYGDDDSLLVPAAGEDPGSGSPECVLQTKLEAVTVAERRSRATERNV